MTRILRWNVVTSLAVAGGLALVAAGSVLPAEAATKNGAATTTVNIRSGPSTSRAVVGRLVRGQRIQVTGTSSGGWIKVRFNRRTAYMYGKYVTTGTRPSGPTRITTSGTTITTYGLNVRTGPSTAYRVVGSLSEGTRVKPTGRFKSGYAEFSYGSSKRWVSMAYLGRAFGSTAAPTAPPAPTPASTSGSRGTIALDFARSQLGKPYQFGAAGPNAYDCSGLAQTAWARAGVSIPRVTTTQFTFGKAVAQSDLRLGDLVFFYGPSPSHVGLYAGNGMIIHSPRPGKVVEYTKISYMPYAGARRPG
jgi:cell wall-associated NlpC family hydrolase